MNKEQQEISDACLVETIFLFEFFRHFRRNLQIFLSFAFVGPRQKVDISFGLAVRKRMKHAGSTWQGCVST